MDLGKKIRQMQEYLDTEQIAKAVEIPIEVVESYINGKIDDSALENYDIGRPPEIKIVEKRKFIRSRVVGVISQGGAGGSTFAAMLAASLANRTNNDVAILDINSISTIPYILGIDDNNYANNVNYILDANCMDKRQMGEISNLYTYVKRPEIFKEGRITGSEAVYNLSERYGTVIVDIPLDISIINELVTELDLIMLVVKQNYLGLIYLKNLGNTLLKDKIMSKMVIIPNFDGGKNYLDESDFRRASKRIIGVEVMESLPYDADIELSVNSGRLYNSINESRYNRGINKIIDILYPEYKTIANNGGIFKKLLGLGR